jgi:hypothetical protein
LIAALTTPAKTALGFAMQEQLRLPKSTLQILNLELIKPHLHGLKMKQFSEIKVELQEVSNDLLDLSKTKNLYGFNSRLDGVVYEFDRLASDCDFLNQTMCVVTPCNVSIAIDALRAAQEYLIAHTPFSTDAGEKEGHLYAYLSKGMTGLLNRASFERALDCVDEVRKATANEYAKRLSNDPPHEALDANQ